MSRYVAFLRAVNVGGRTVEMARLRAIFTGIGFTAVDTLLASGNVIFESRSTDPAELEKLIEPALARELGFEVACFVRTLPQLAAVVAHESLAGSAEYAAVNIAFTRPCLTESSRHALAGFEAGLDRFHPVPGGLLWLCRVKQSESKFSNAILEKAARVQSTIRTLNTLQRILAKYGQ